jgi:hypothetical protein
MHCEVCRFKYKTLDRALSAHCWSYSSHGNLLATIIFPEDDGFRLSLLLLLLLLLPALLLLPRADEPPERARRLLISIANLLFFKFKKTRGVDRPFSIIVVNDDSFIF